MKQVEVTPDILSLLRKAAGPEVDVANFAVFEATALNTLPLRKKHPLYNKAVTTRGALQAMADALVKESRPIQLVHDAGTMPVGRVFTGQVLDGQTDSELRVLFWVDKTHADLVNKLDNGTIDQVSVNLLNEKILCSDCGFDYLGPDASLMNVLEGTDSEGHVLGENGIHARLVGLDSWLEMSLVPQGGAQNARVVSRDQSVFGSNYQRLAASGRDPNSMVLTAIANKETKMDLKALTDQLIAQTTELTTIKASAGTLTASVTAKDAEIAALNQKLADAGNSVAALTAKDTEITSLKATVTAALTALKDIAKNVLVATGNVNPTIPDDVDQVVALISDKSKGLAAALVAGGKAKDPITDALDKAKVVSTSGFRTAR